MPLPDTQVLIVEDEPDGLDLIQRALTLHGISVAPFKTGESAISAIVAAPQTYCAAVLDLMLPGMGGFELMQFIRSHPLLANIPVIAVTAFHTPEQRVQATEAGFTDYMQKPLDLQKLAHRLKSLLG